MISARAALRDEAASLETVRALSGAHRPASVRSMLADFREPVRFEEEIRTKAAFGGRYQVVLHPNLRVDFSGQVKAGGATSHDFTLPVTVTAPFWTANGRIEKCSTTFVAAGSTYGALEAGDREFRWDQKGLLLSSPVTWAGLRRAEITRNLDYASNLGSVGNVLEWVGKLALASATAGSVGAGLVIGSTAASMLGLDDLTLPGLVGVVVSGGAYLLLGPAAVVPVFLGTAATFEVAKDQIQRSLTDAERAVTELVFQGTVNPDRVRINRFTGIGGRPFVMPSLGNTIHINAGPTRFDRYLIPGPNQQANAPLGHVGNFVHEMTHVWQIQNTSFAPAYFCRSWATAADSARSEDISKSIYEPGPPGKRWDQYGVEAQCTIVERWYVGDSHGPPRSENSPWFPYIRDHIRSGRD